MRKILNKGKNIEKSCLEVYNSVKCHKEAEKEHGKTQILGMGNGCVSGHDTVYRL